MNQKSAEGASAQAAHPDVAKKPSRPVKDSRRPRLPARDAGAYPELHPPTRARRDGKPARTLVFLHGGNVANWSWDPQVKAFADYEVLTPHLPGFGARSDEEWSGLDSAADDVAAFIADEVESGGVHLVGISLGGVVALRVLARHPELVSSVMLSGVAAMGVDSTTRALGRIQVNLWGKEWFWRFQAGSYGMAHDERQLFTDHGTRIRPENARAIMAEVHAGGVPGGLGDYTGPALVLAGAKEPSLVVRSFPLIGGALPQSAFRVVPGRHHQWNIEDPILFNATVRAWIEKGEIHQRLRDVPAK